MRSAQRPSVWVIAPGPGKPSRTAGVVPVTATPPAGRGCRRRLTIPATARTLLCIAALATGVATPLNSLLCQLTTSRAALGDQGDRFDLSGSHCAALKKAARHEEIGILG